MKFCVRVVTILSICVLAGGSVFGAKIKKRNGQVLEGEIQGALLLKGKGWQIRVGRNLEYVSSYLLVSGKEIDSIDEEGIHISQSGVVLLQLVGNQNRPPYDSEVLKAVSSYLAKSGSPGEAGLSTPTSRGPLLVLIALPAMKKSAGHKEALRVMGGASGKRAQALVEKAIELEELFSEKYSKATPNADGKLISSWQERLLGEEKDGQLMRAIRLKTGEGVVAIPIQEIVAFGQ